MAHVGVVLLVLISLLVDTEGGHGKHKKPKNAGRIVNGVQGEQSEFPFLANVQRKSGREGDNYEAWQRSGSGAIVSRYNVLTSCHVIADLDVGTDDFNQKPQPYTPDPRKIIRPGRLKVLSWRQLRVYVGSGNNLFQQTDTGQYRQARQLIPHPNCEADGTQFVKNDVGVIKLLRPFDYNYRVQPISVISLDLDEALDSARNLVRQQVWCKATGWGETDNEPVMPHNLFWVADVQLIANDYCWSRFDTHHYVCTLNPTQSMCSGDSGGPLACQGHLYGLHSSSKCTPGQYNYMANIEPIVYMMNHHVELDPPLGKRASPDQEENKEHVFVEPEGHNIHGGGGRKRKKREISNLN